MGIETLEINIYHLLLVSRVFLDLKCDIWILLQFLFPENKHY